MRLNIGPVRLSGSISRKGSRPLPKARVSDIPSAAPEAPPADRAVPSEAVQPVVKVKRSMGRPPLPLSKLAPGSSYYRPRSPRPPG